MKAKIFLVLCCCLMACESGRCDSSGLDSVFINGVQPPDYALCYNCADWQAGYSGWMGFVYVQYKDSDFWSDNISFLGLDGFDVNGYFETYHVFIHDGDSVNIFVVYGDFGSNERDTLHNKTFFGAVSLSDSMIRDGDCIGTALTIINVVVQIMPDSLEAEYEKLKIVDSLHVADSVKSLDSLATIQNIESGRQNIIYPNPTSGILNFTNYYNNSGLAQVKMYDITGAVVLQQSFTVSKGLQNNTVDMGNLPGGVYLIEYTINGARRMEKVVKM